MGFIDAIKRWKLAQQGMSSGKKRRTHEQGSLTGSMDRSFGVRTLLYLLFIFLSTILMLRNPSSYESLFGTAAFLQIALCFAVIAVFEIQHSHKPRNVRVILMFGSISLHLLLVHLVGIIFRGTECALLALPFALAPMITSVLLNRQGGIFATLAVTLSGLLIVPKESLIHYAVMSMFCGLMVVYLTKNVRRRGSLLRAGVYAGVVVLVLAVTYGMIELPDNGDGWADLGQKCGSALGVSILIAMIVSGLLPVLEGIFGITTDISWLELSDLNHKLMKRLQLEAPGTFHHSLVVASLAEAAAESIGANAPMCRVCAYFHDIGKLKKPEYFIENQGEENLHDTITPTMSALVIIAHVKDGVDLAVKHKLNPLIIDVIKEHHGDSLVYYFYHKANELKREGEGKVEKGLEKAEDITMVNEKNFRYPGPIPSSKESGIISLADAIESASRTIRKPTPSKIRALVDELVMKRVSEGQLDNCRLSLRELKQVRESFSTTLRSMLHSRIDYPKEKEKEKEKDKRDDRERKSDLGSASAAFKVEKSAKKKEVKSADKPVDSDSDALKN
ncbi:MAG: HDIG domain-containing metalloprotein [Akkermansiaceae bacterium]